MVFLEAQLSVQTGCSVRHEKREKSEQQPMTVAVALFSTFCSPVLCLSGLLFFVAMALVTSLIWRRCMLREKVLFYDDEQVNAAYMVNMSLSMAPE